MAPSLRVLRSAGRPSARAGPADGVRELRGLLTDYRRTWRGSIISSVLGPLLYLVRARARPGHDRGRRHGARVEPGRPVSYLLFLAPALLAARAMQTAMGECDATRCFGSVKWNRIYHAAIASPLRPGDIFRGHLLFVTLADR